MLRNLSRNDHQFGIYTFNIYLDIIGVEEKYIPYKFFLAKYGSENGIFTY